MNKDSRQSFADYAKILNQTTGTIVSQSTISRFFNYAFDVRGNFLKPYLIPLDKFRLENIVNAKEFLRFIIKRDMRRAKFGDEQHLRGSELYCKETRWNVVTSEVAPVLTNSDFRNTYTIIGFCGIDTRAKAVFNFINNGTNDAQSFSDTLIRGISLGVFSIRYCCFR